LKITLFIITLLTLLHTAEINPKLYEGDVTQLNLYYKQMKHEIKNSIASDEASKARLRNEILLLSKIQQLLVHKSEIVPIKNDFIGQKTIKEEDFLESFNALAEILVQKKSIKKNNLLAQKELAFLKDSIENLLESEKENLRFYQLQFAYYKIRLTKDKEALREIVSIIDDGIELLKNQIDKVVFNAQNYPFIIEELDEKINNIDKKFIALNLSTEIELLSLDAISKDLELKLATNIKNKNKYLQERFDMFLLQGLYAYQQKEMKVALMKQKLMKKKVRKCSKENELYRAKYLLLRALIGGEIDTTDCFMLNVKELIEIFYRDFKKQLKEPLFVYDEKPILIGNLFKALLILILGFIIAKVYHRQFIKLHNRRQDLSTISIKVLAYFGFTVILLIALFIAITTAGFSIANLAVIAGALSIGLGFALRSVVANYIAGIVVMSEKHIKLGHFIRVDDLRIGKVVDIGLRATVIRTIDNTHIIIPNNDLIEKDVLNLTLEDRIRRIYIPFKIPYGSDIKSVRSLIIKAVNESDIKLLRDVYGKKPNVWMRNMGESFIELDLFVWIEGYRPSTKSHLLILIHDTLLQHNIKMPYPQLDLHLKQKGKSQNLETNILGSMLK